MINATAIEEVVSVKQYVVGPNDAQFQGFKQVKNKQGEVFAIAGTFKVLTKDEDGNGGLTKKVFDLFVTVYQKPTTVDMGKYNMLMTALGKPLVKTAAEALMPESHELTPDWLKPVTIILDNSRDKKYIDFPKYDQKVLPLGQTVAPGESNGNVAKPEQNLGSWKDA